MIPASAHPTVIGLSHWGSFDPFEANTTSQSVCFPAAHNCSVNSLLMPNSCSAINTATDNPAIVVSKRPAYCQEKLFVTAKNDNTVIKNVKNHNTCHFLFSCRSMCLFSVLSKRSGFSATTAIPSHCFSKPGCRFKYSFKSVINSNSPPLIPICAKKG